MYLIVLCEVNYLIQTVMVSECSTSHIDPTLTPIKQPLELCLGDAGSLTGVKLSK
jgi:hypothetical protein